MTTVYWAGGEDVSFETISFSTDASHVNYRSTYSRGSIWAGGPAVTTLPLTKFATTPQFGPLSSFWVHGQFTSNSGDYSTESNGILLVVYDASGDARLAIRGTGTAGQIKISTINTSGTFTDLVTSAAGVLNFYEPVANDIAPLDFFINYSTAGQATVYWNGTNICDTGTSVNVTTNGVTALGQVSYSLLSSSGGTNQGWSECIVQDTSTLGMALQTLPPVATGNTQSWTGSVGNIDELSINTANYNYTASDNALSEWTVATTLPSGTWQINAVVQSAAVSAGTSGPQHFAWVVRTSAPADYESGTIGLSTSFLYYQEVWNQNPSTSAAWTAGQLINSGIESLA